MDVARSAAAGGGTGAEFRKGWDRILQRLVAEFGQNVFQSWFARLKFDGVEGDVAVLSVPTPFLRSWIRDNYMTRIAAMWREEFDHVAGIDLRLRLPGQKNGVEKAEPAEEPAARPAARSTAGIQSPFGSSAVRQAREVCSGVRGSPSRAENSSPALSRQRASPEYARKTTGRTTPSANASA